MPFLSGQRITFVWYIFASLMAQTVKNLPAIQDIWVQSLGQRSLAWRIPQRSLVGYSPWGHKELDMTEATEHPCMHATLTRSAGATTPSLTSYLLLWAECSFDV